MEKAKVLLTVNTLLGGGVGKSVVDVANSLDPERFDVTLVSMLDGSFSRRLNKNVYYKSYFNKKTIKYFYLLLNRFPKKILYRYFFREKYDIEIAYATVMAPIIQASNNMSSKKIVYQHVQGGDMPLAYYKDFNAMKKSFDRFDGVVCVSNSVKDDYIRRMGSVKNVKVLYNILDIEDILHKSEENIENEYLSREKIRIVSCGRLSKEKGFDRLINVSEKLLLNGVDHELWIIGNGQEYENLDNSIKLKGLQKNVFLLGFQENPYKYIKHCDVYCSASSLEGFSLVIAEAIILGLPIVAINSCGPDELLNYGEYGCLTTNCDDELYNSIRDILVDKERRNYYKQQSEKRIEFFDKLTRQDELMEYLESLLTNKELK